MTRNTDPDARPAKVFYRWYGLNYMRILYAGLWVVQNQTLLFHQYKFCGLV